MPQAPDGRETQGLVQTDAENAGRAQPLITVITPCLNAVDTISENVLSVLAAQEAFKRSGWELEHLIVDGGSVDGTAELVAKHSAKHSFCHWIPKINGGPYAAMNVGLKYVNGRYTHVLNSDDLLLDPEAYAAFVQEGREKEARVLIASIGYFRRPSLRLRSLWWVESIPASKSEWRQQLLQGLHYPHPGFIADSKIYKAEAFDQQYSLSADYKLMQAILLGPAMTGTTLVCGQPLVAMAEGGATGNWKAILKGWRQLAAINQELGIQASSIKRYWGKLKQRVRPLPKPISVNSLEAPER